MYKMTVCEPDRLQVQSNPFRELGELSIGGKSWSGSILFRFLPSLSS